MKLDTDRNLKDGGTLSSARTELDLRTAQQNKWKWITIALIVAGGLVLVGTALLAYVLSRKENTLRTNETMRPIYSEGVKYEFRYAYSVSESMRLKSEDSRKENSNAGFDMNVSVAVV